MKLLISSICSFFFLVCASAQEAIKLGIIGTPAYHQVSWIAEVGSNYLVEVSPDLSTWADLGIVQPGTGTKITYGFEELNSPTLFYRIRIRPNAIRDGFDDVELARQDDAPSDLSPIGFPIKLFGEIYTECYVNFNGNITFGGALRKYTPEPLQVIGVPIIAPFWADVDVRGPKSKLVTYSHGVDQVDGRSAFGVNWMT